MYSIISSTVYMYSNSIMVINSIRICSMESIWTCSMESIWTIPWNPDGLVHGIHGGYAYIPYGIDHSMIIPHGIHDVHGTMNWLWSQPTLIPWIPDGIPDGFHGFQVDSIWIILGKVKTSKKQTLQKFCNEKAHTTNFCGKKAHTIQTFVVSKSRHYKLWMTF